MTRCATPQNETFLLDIARHGTAHHVAVLLRKYQRTQRLRQGKQEESSAQTDQTQYQERQLDWHYDEDGMLVVRGRLTPEDGALFIKAVNEVFRQSDSKDAAAEVKCVSAETISEVQNSADAPAPDPIKGVSAETFLEDKGPTFTQRRADGLMRLVEHALQTLPDEIQPLAASDRQQIVIHIEPDTLLHDVESEGATCSIENGPLLSPVTARRLACDAGLMTVLQNGEGNILNVGRKTRSIPPALRRALTLRDRGSRFPGGCESRFVDAHHIHHWCDGGETRMDNLVLLCRRHHRLVHEQGFTINYQGAGRFTFTRPTGGRYLEVLFPQFGDESAAEELAIERQHQRMGVVIDERTACSDWEGEKIDYGWAVGVMQDLEGVI